MKMVIEFLIFELAWLSNLGITDNFNFFDQICSKRVFPVENKKMNITIELRIFQLFKETKFSLKNQYGISVTNVPNKGNFCRKQKSEYHYWILHFWIILLRKFQLQRKIISFFTKCTKEEYLQSKTKKSKHHHWILHIWISLGTSFSLNGQFRFFEPNLSQKCVSYRKYEKWTSPLISAYFNYSRNQTSA